MVLRPVVERWRVFHRLVRPALGEGARPAAGLGRGLSGAELIDTDATLRQGAGEISWGDLRER